LNTGNVADNRPRQTAKVPWPREFFADSKEHEREESAEAAMMECFEYGQSISDIVYQTDTLWTRAAERSGSHFFFEYWANDQAAKRQHCFILKSIFACAQDSWGGSDQCFIQALQSNEAVLAEESG
jgi:hypothetical protein